MINELLKSFLEINKTSAHSAGDAARLLASRTKYYKNIINDHYKKDHNNLPIQELLNLHVKLVEVEVTQKQCNHMIHDSINFIERLINDKIRKQQ